MHPKVAKVLTMTMPRPSAKTGNSLA